MSIDPNGHRLGASVPVGEDPVDVGRYLAALRRSAAFIVATAAIVTGTVLAVSLTLPKSYEATAKVVVNNPGSAIGSNETAAVQRSLATTATLATSPAVLGDAASSVPGETRTALAKRVTSSVEETANIIDIKVSYPTARGAARLADTVARAFISQHAAIQRSDTASTVSALYDQIAKLQARKSAEPAVAGQLAALQARAAEVEAVNAGSGSEMQLAGPPPVPSGASSPRPLRNALIALFASLFLVVLVVLAREQLTPRVTSQRELGHLLGLPVLSGVPLIRRRVDAMYARAEYEAYQTLSASLRLALPASSEPHIILVTSATHGDGKSTVTARLGRALSQAGNRTLIVSGDLRWPKLDETFGVDGQPGLHELLSHIADDPSTPAYDVDELILPTQREGVRRRGDLDILPAGKRDGEASELLSTPALPAFMTALRASSYAYVLIDSAPLLGVVDGQMFAQFCDEMLVVARMGHLKVSDVVDLRELLDRIDCDVAGLVVIGTRLASSPYYAGEAPMTEPSRVRLVD
jgi:succinoglycan biosynthesis transport protein ExoP